MSYHPPYEGQYAGFPGYGQAQEQTPQYYGNDMHYPVQQQQMQTPQQMYVSPSDVDLYPVQQYLQQHRQPMQAQVPPPQSPTQYGSAFLPYPGDQYSQVQYQQPQYSAPQYPANMVRLWRIELRMEDELIRCSIAELATSCSGFPEGTTTIIAKAERSKGTCTTVRTLWLQQT